MGMEVGTKPTIRSEINVVPLIDIVLVLLIIFMVVTPMLQKGVPVQLPTGADPDKKPDTRDDVILSVKIDETLYYNSDGPLMEADVETRLRELADRAPGSPLFIKADKRLSYGKVKEVMLLAEKSGFKSVSLVAEAPQ